MNERGKSDNPVVPAKPPNNAASAVMEVVEERGLAKGNTDRPTRPGLSAGPDVPNGLDRVREVARRDSNARFTALARRALLRQNPRQEPSAVVPHAGICAGGRP